jgi:hypothetical protein
MRKITADSVKANNHYFKSFGPAVMIVLIGTGIDMVVPQNFRLATQDAASDAARHNFGETFGDWPTAQFGEIWTCSRSYRSDRATNSMCA